MSAAISPVQLPKEFAFSLSGRSVNFPSWIVPLCTSILADGAIGVCTWFVFFFDVYNVAIMQRFQFVLDVGKFVKG